MANPKRKFSKSRTGQRHSQWKLREVTISICPQCKHPRLPHRVCTNCGFYNGRLVLSMAKSSFREKRRERKKRETLGTQEGEEEKKE